MCEAGLMHNKLCDALEGEDDMIYGDLGNGFKKHSGIYESEGFHEHTVRSRSSSARKSLSSDGEEHNAVFFHCSKCNSLNDVPVKKLGRNGFAPSKPQASSEFNSEASNEELKQHLQEILEEVEILRVELEASQRHLEGKEQALKILQSMAVLDKATTHTKAVFIKSEQQKRALEKEINILQWEIKINQEKLKNIDETWAEKYDRIYCENAAFKETLKMKTEEIKLLKSENQFLEQQHLEMVAMLDVKQQKLVQDNICLSKSGVTEVTSLELAVLGACACNGPEGVPCACAKMSAATRKQLLQLKQEFELMKKSKEEAYIMADAFRIAFEQQLMRRKDQAFRLAQMSKICRKETKTVKWKSSKEDEKRKSLGEKLIGMLASGPESKKVEELDNPLEIIRTLTDLLNDKEEMLAHQRKVSYMLARTLEDKENALQQRKESTFSEEKVTFKNSQYKQDLNPQEWIFPERSCCQDGFSSAPNTNPSRTSTSHSTGSGIPLIPKLANQVQNSFHLLSLNPGSQKCSGSKEGKFHPLVHHVHHRNQRPKRNSTREPRLPQLTPETLPNTPSGGRGWRRQLAERRTSPSNCAAADESIPEIGSGRLLQVGGGLAAFLRACVGRPARRKSWFSGKTKV